MLAAVTLSLTVVTRNMKSVPKADTVCKRCAQNVACTDDSYLDLLIMDVIAFHLVFFSHVVDGH